MQGGFKNEDPTWMITNVFKFLKIFFEFYEKYMESFNLDHLQVHHTETEIHL